ncbi:Serine protease HTRA1 [Liparis tanakae]|uniref:Serine protease HTRA1 n=1 Tax=Liparis tanakae TaxID=230148 RepID=A0A4Z2HTU8_9TELE|nr:Serine protease HTRA1 [Liparis tanakae]
MKMVAFLALLASVVQAIPLRKSHTCPSVCDTSRCPPPPSQLACYYGRAADGCGCCVVCASGEGDACGESSGLPCGEGLLCDSIPRKLGSTCVCASSGPVCGSDGRTYPSVCRLAAENRRAELGQGPAVLLIQRGWCDSVVPKHRVAGMQHQGSMRYKFNFIADVVDKIVPAVVHLELFQGEPFSSEEVSVSSGSGFVVSEDGWIITSAHVLNNRRRIKVELKSGSQYDASVKDVDQKMDIALIKIEPDNTVTTGIISTAQRNGLQLGLKDPDMDYIQTDAIINYGNSGGPLVNLDGDVIGINTLKVAAGISFAVPADRIRQFLAEAHSRQANRNTAEKKKSIGVRMLQLSPSLIRDLKENEAEFPDVSSGVYVYEVIPGTAASSAGLMGRDVILAIDGRLVGSTRDVMEAVRSADVLSVVVRRKGEDVTLTLTPKEME